MPTAKGTFKRVSKNRIEASFVINDILETYDADVNPALPPFTSNNCTLTYDDPEKMTGTKSFKGSIGMEPFQLTLNDGLTIAGTLNVPGLDHGYTVDGRGQWSED
ncbi:hypothetical protein VFPFJ_11629 [Purpureocillium lilacinum]|uniref:Uncharacterized protein n=1 Tax=Purpureocillium lilacinum TaxID=33203 RepID=A0A179F0W6_PURLI|nr:hypothetical protein VFPFJ_11629 [Purpureocillium lilacinum]OAQ58789.1 hypothetical protein VFPFJ_11629 [Purpureocillium lilacinum]